MLRWFGEKFIPDICVVAYHNSTFLINLVDYWHSDVGSWQNISVAACHNSTFLINLVGSWHSDVGSWHIHVGSRHIDVASRHSELKKILNDVA